jgi:GH35 family endo-1,4-beta-xylanase
MKIRIVTERKIKRRDYWAWIRSLRENGVPIDGSGLLMTGKCEFRDDYGYTRAKTVYEIVEK